MKVRKETNQKKDEIYTLTMGFSELEVIHALLLETYQKLPRKVKEIHPFRSRVYHMKKLLGHQIEEHRKEVGGGYKAEEYVTVKKGVDDKWANAHARFVADVLDGVKPEDAYKTLTETIDSNNEK